MKQLTPKTLKSPRVATTVFAPTRVTFRLLLSHVGLGIIVVVTATDVDVVSLEDVESDETVDDEDDLLVDI